MTEKNAAAVRAVKPTTNDNMVQEIAPIPPVVRKQMEDVFIKRVEDTKRGCTTFRE